MSKSERWAAIPDHPGWEASSTGEAVREARTKEESMSKPMVDVLVRHERHDWRATTVVIDGSISEGSEVLVRRAREHLRIHDYETYCFVTDHPRPQPGARADYRIPGSDAQ